MRAYGWPFALWGAFTWTHQSSERWALKGFRGTVDVGYYSVLFQLGYYPISMLSTFMVQLVTPVIFGRAGDATDDRRTHEAHRLNLVLLILTLAGTAIATTIAAAFHIEIFALLVGPTFRHMSIYLPLMTLAGGLFAAGQVASLLIATNITTTRLIAPKIGTAIIGTVMNIVGAYAFGIAGVAWAMVSFGAIYLLWITWLIRPSVSACMQGR